MNPGVQRDTTPPARTLTPEQHPEDQKTIKKSPLRRCSSFDYVGTPYHLSEQMQRSASFCTRLTYRTSDPYAVEAHFLASTGSERVWVFARELLKEGVQCSTGVGDVIVWPETGQADHDEQRIFIRLTSPEGTALLSAAETDVQVFLEATRKLVDYGAEHTQLASTFATLDAALGKLTCPGFTD